MAPPSFASAAAGNSTPNTPSRTDSGGDWAPRRTNGLTQTFRRPSIATATAPPSTAPRESGNNAPAGVYVPPHRNGSYIDTRYSKNQLLDLFKAHAEGSAKDDLANLFMPGWEPSAANGVLSGAWSRRDEQAKDSVPGPEVCWDRDGLVAPLGLVDMSEEEKEVFTSVNSPLKPPTQTKQEGAVREGGSNRKISISHVNTPGPYGLNSPSTTRPGVRRRETQDAYPFPNSPSVAKPARDDPRTTSPPPALTRRRTDYKDAPPGSKSEASEDKPPEEMPDTSRTPFGSIRRAPTGPVSAGVVAPASPWASTPQATSFSPMGAFGNFAIGPNAAAAAAAAAAPGTPSDKRPGIAGGRAESRFKGLMSKDNADEARSLKEKHSVGNLAAGGWRPGNDSAHDHLAEEADDDVPTGSAALGGGDDSPVHERDRIEFGAMGTPSRRPSKDSFGFGAFGMTSDATGLRGLIHQQDQYHGTPQGRSQQQQRPQSQQQGPNDPMSPTDTNPYQSPEHHGVEPDEGASEGSDIPPVHLPGLGGFVNDGVPGIGGFGGIANLGRVPAAPPSDRSQTSSVGPQRGFAGLAGLGGLGAIPGLGGSSAWGSTQGNMGTPTRERAGLATNFADNLFASSAEVQSPSLSGLAGLGHSNFFSNAPGAGRGPSRLGNFLPAGMQDQMRSQQYGEEGSDQGDFAGHGAPHRDTDSPFRAQAGDLGGANFADQGRSVRQDLPFGQFGTQTPIPGSAGQEPIGARPMQPASFQQQPVSSSASNQPPAAQQKTMVMPDRMRWIYRDPQGNTQGPWSGLEMHDWYKAGFFSPELLVKKFEDPEYEPLAQLIRRIGNSREPFLVPQIGIPHGTASSANPATAWNNGPLTVPAAGAQPPFANSFPSFGTTLTADQQNALERRKQEEQYLMARQKEHLAQQQIAQKYQLQGQYGMLPQLQHHSSAQSLHSQPSFGSITSPAAYQTAPHQGSSQQNVPGFFDNSFRNAPIGGLGAGLGAVGAGVDLLGNIREEELPGLLDRLNVSRQNPTQLGGVGQSSGQEQQVAQMLNDRQRLQQEQSQQDAALHFRSDQPASNDRFLQFQGLQPDAHADPFNVAPEGVIGKPIGPPTDQLHQTEHDGETRSEETLLKIQEAEKKRSAEDEILQPEVVKDSSVSKPQAPLSLTEQVQKAQSAKQSPVPQSAWAKIDTTLPQPFPPAPSQSPLPAPAAQRSRHNMADALHAESRSRSQTPSLDTPSASVAPWAKEPAEAARGPSLKEIQEAEAKVAAEKEAVAAEVRRAALEKEILAQTQNIAPAPGLPSSSTWASANASPSTPLSATPSAWAKAAVKASAVPNSAKTLAQIQKEEEARKKRQVAAAAAVAQTTAATSAALQSAGKRYADLASKVASPILGSAVGASAWTTVGASGKVKTPAPTPAPVAARVVSAATPVPAIKKPVVSRPATSASGATVNAQEEFKKWAVNELKHDLQKGMQAEDFVSNLLALGNEVEIVMHAVHSVTSTIDSRHFAEEFLRRHKLAEKGLVDFTKTSSPANATTGQSGGWSEVAKKGPAKAPEEANVGGNFKVVAPKKKVAKK